MGRWHPSRFANPLNDASYTKYMQSTSLPDFNSVNELENEDLTVLDDIHPSTWEIEVKESKSSGLSHGAKQ